MTVCKPLPMTSLLRRMLSGDVERGTCVFCLCEETLVAPSHAVTLGPGRSATVAQLVDQLHMPQVSTVISSKKLCTCCVEQLKNFYLFRNKVMKSISIVENLSNIVDREIASASAKFLDVCSGDLTQSYSDCSLNIHIDLSRLFETKTLECPKCYMNFSSYGELTKHQKVHGRSPYCLCRLCHQHFRGSRMFEAHWALTHPDRPAPHHWQNQQLKSKLLGRRTDAENTNKALNEERMYNCNESSKIIKPKMEILDQIFFDDPDASNWLSNVKMEIEFDDLDESMTEFAVPEIKREPSSPTEEIETHYCELCDELFSDIAIFIDHCKSVHPKRRNGSSSSHRKPNSNGKYKCSYCNKELVTIRNLDLHIARAHKEEMINERNRERPESEFESSRMLPPNNNNGTVQRIKGNQDSSDDWFESYFSVANSLQKSKQSNRMKKNKDTSDNMKAIAKMYKCGDIDQFRNEFGLFECRKCYADFPTFKDWSVHQNIHGKSPYNHCRLCDDTFNGFLGLVAHFAAVHPGQNAPPRMSKAHPIEKCICEYCKKIFRSKKSLMYHMFRQHNDYIKLEKCRICNQKFIHGHKCRFACPECPNSPCIHHKYLQAHMRNEKARPKSKHKCIDCWFEYRKKEDLIHHVNKDHLLILPHLCSECGKKLASLKALKIHELYSHPQKVCPHCNLAMQKYHLERHIPICKTLEKPFSCDVCEGIFASKEQAENHRKSHMPFITKCRICQFKCQSSFEIKQHMVQYHNDQIEKESKEKSAKVEKAVPKEGFPCLKCTLDFKSEEECLEHESTHPIDDGYLCRECDRMYVTKADRFECVRSHKGDATEVCPICGRVFQKLCFQGHLKRHVLKGEVEEPKKEKVRRVLPKTHMCDICGSLHSSFVNLRRHKEKHKPFEKCEYCLKYIEKRHLNRHLAIHNNGPKRQHKMPKLSCKECEFTTRYRSIFVSHLNRVHRGIKPYECETCGKKFYSKQNLECHVRGTHNVTVQKCEVCHLDFRSAKGFKLHMMKHRGELPHSCEHCDMKFVSSSRKKEHQERTHFSVLYKCTQCDKEFTRQLSLKNHILVIHQGGRGKKGKKPKVHIMSEHRRIINV